jgi:hypothetical protein
VSAVEADATVDRVPWRFVMRRFRLPFSWFLGFALGAALLVPLASRDASFTRRESARLHAHFARVLDQLRARDVSSWSAARQADRRRLIVLLEDYDRAGRFPRNEGHLARRTPIFVDRHETRCAMAQLIERSGGAALVARIAATRNLGYIRELADDAALARWVAASGLDLAEAALIQPEYPPGPGPQPPSLPPPPASEHGIMTTGVLLSAGLALPAITLNLLPHASVATQRQVRAFGVVVAAPALAAGFVDMFDDGQLSGPGVAQLTIGTASLALALARRVRSSPAGDVPATPAPRVRSAPIFRAGVEGEPQVGVALAF